MPKACVNSCRNGVAAGELHVLSSAVSDYTFNDGDGTCTTRMPDTRKPTGPGSPLQPEQSSSNLG
jgi:hypothetical protein